MEKRTLVAIVLSFLVLVGYQYFFAPKQQKATSAPQQPAVQQKQQTGQGIEQNVQSFYTTHQHTLPEAVIHVQAPFYAAVLTPGNVAIKHWDLKDYKTALAPGSPSVDLIGDIKGVVYPMWESFDGSSFTMPSTIPYTCSALAVTVPSARATKTIVCSYTTHSLVLKKILTFYGNSYTATVSIELTNVSGTPLTERLGINWSGLSGELGSRYDIADGIMLINNSRDTIDAKSLNLSKSYDGLIQWFGTESRYFIQTVIPGEAEPAHLYATRTESTQHGLIPLLLTYIYNPKTVKPGDTSATTYTVFLGPKDMNVLNAAGHNLNRAIYFGWSDIIAKPIFYVLRFIDQFVHNYGWSIVLLTILIRIILFPLGQIGFKSMRQMQKLAPKINELKEKYKDDKERQYREMTNLYRTYKINPLGGCLPILLQIPIFIALYEVLLSAIELRQSPFIWWIKDLAVPDSIGTLHLMGFQIGLHVLPLVMGVTMFFQQMLMPTTGDQTQAKILLWVMPIMLTVLFWGFPAGLVLYWTVNNVFSIGQQYYILKKY